MLDLLVPSLLCLLSMWVAPEASLKSLAIGYPSSRPVSLDNLPVDVALFIADYLSVKDLVRVAQVNSSARYIFRSKSIWFRALHDILQVRPLPRLQLALPTLDRNELIEACVASYRLDGVLGTSNHQPIVRRQSPLKERLPTGSAWIVPGGRYYLLMEDQYRKISLYTTSDGVKVMDVLNVPGQPNILPEFRLQIVSVSRDVFLVGHLFRPKGHDYERCIRVVLCDPVGREISTVFSRSYHFRWLFDFDLSTSRIAVLARSTTEMGLHINIHDFGTGTTEPADHAIELYDANCCSLRTLMITFISSTQLLLSDRSDVAIVDMKDIPKGTTDADPIALKPLWQHGGIMFASFSPMLVTRCHLQTVSQRLFIWAGETLQMFYPSLDRSSAWETSAYKVEMDGYRANGKLAFLGMNCGVYGLLERSTGRHTSFCAYSATGEAAHRRLDRRVGHIHEGSLGSLCPVGYRPTSMSYDEESGVFVVIASDGAENTLIVLDMI